MNMVRESWTDERLDDLNHKVDELGRRMEDGFHDLRGEMNARFERVDDRFDGLEARFDPRFDAIHRTMVQFGGAMIVALVGLIATQLGLILTQI
jgi:hypothetical protein